MNKQGNKETCIDIFFDMGINEFIKLFSCKTRQSKNWKATGFSFSISWKVKKIFLKLEMFLKRYKKHPKLPPTEKIFTRIDKLYRLD
jgi:hypothetical protein